MTSPKNKRTPPSRDLDQYVLYHVISQNVGVAKIHDSAMTDLNLSFGDISAIIDLGFSVTINGETYTRLRVSAFGYLWLLDRSSSGAGGLTVSGGNQTSNTFNTNGAAGSGQLILAPWATPLDASAPFDANFEGSTNQAAVRTSLGFEPKTRWQSTNDVKFGVRHFLDVRSPLGRRHIIRWNVRPNVSISFQQTNLRFDAIIYENGRIEFCYDPALVLDLQGDPHDAAFCGIIASGTVSSSVFRDCSNLLGYDTNREPHPRGGVGFISGYTDRSASYANQLTASRHWPCGDRQNQGAMFVFSPPTQVRRVIKTKISTDASHNSLPPKSSIFSVDDKVFYDDRSTLVYGEETPVNMPTTLKLFFGDKTEEVTERQNLFTSLSVTSSISKAASNSFLDDRVKKYVTPFSDSELWESERDVAFFVSGSSTQNTDVSIGQPLATKDKLTINLPVNFKTTMPGLTSSLYYYNVGARQWVTPRNSSYVLTNTTDIVKPVGSIGSDLRVSSNGANQTNYALEDMRGFGPIGNYVASGTTPTSFSLGNLTTAVASLYTKSVTINPEYTGNGTETFSLPITQPFLLEKAVIQLPLEMGQSWFSDKTTVFSPISSSNPPFGSSFDFAGPLVTVALMHQYRVDEFSSSFRRNVILSGTLTHVNDDTMILSMSSFTGDVSSSNYHYLRPAGIRAFGLNVSTIVSPQSNNQFSGTVRFNCEPAVSNGAVLYYHTRSATPTQVRNMLSASHIDLNGKTNDSSYAIAYVNPIGRAAAGFEIDGRSLPGGDFRIFDGATTVQNSLHKLTHLASGSVQSDLEQIASSNNFTASMMTAIPLLQHTVSPYLLMPGDRLVLSLAKMRPFLYSTQTHSTKSASGSFPRGHDVRLTTGSISITFYGSQIRENAEVHTVRSQNIASNAIHEVSIGNDLVVDQYEVEQRRCFIGSSTDNFITGSLVTVSYNEAGQVALMTGSRSKLFSAFSADTIPRRIENGVLFSEAFRPWYRYVGTPRFAQITDAKETWYDSMVPNIDQCMKINGADIYFWDLSDPPQRALLVFNAASGISSDKDWYRSFPFESRYNTVTRQRGFYLAVNTSKRITDGDYGTSLITDDERRTHTGINVYVQFNPSTPQFYGDSDDTTDSFNFGTRPLSQTDALRTLYGFGDKYAFHLDGSETCGANYLPTYSQHPSASYLAISPIIRGWRYGLISGVETKTKAHWRPGRFGQFRDMLEQRPYSKFVAGTKVSVPPVTVKFVTAAGTITNAENTWSSNLSNEVTSSLPYFDGVVRNRGDINVNTINQGIITFNNDNGNVSL